MQDCSLLNFDLTNDLKYNKFRFKCCLIKTYLCSITFPQNLTTAIFRDGWSINAFTASAWNELLKTPHEVLKLSTCHLHSPHWWCLRLMHWWLWFMAFSIVAIVCNLICHISVARCLFIILSGQQIVFGRTEVTLKCVKAHSSLCVLYNRAFDF